MIALLQRQIKLLEYTINTLRKELAEACAGGGGGQPQP